MSSPEGCTGKLCEFAVDAQQEEILCETGIGNCSDAYFLELEASKFHDSALNDATGKINEILGAIPQDKDGRQLSFLFTPNGIALAWVRHGIVSRHDGDAVMAKALKVKS